jgi:hypothetical protein
VMYTPRSCRIIPMQWIRAGFHGNMHRAALWFTYPVRAGSYRSKACLHKVSGSGPFAQVSTETRTNAQSRGE